MSWESVYILQHIVITHSACCVFTCNFYVGAVRIGLSLGRDSPSGREETLYLVWKRLALSGTEETLSLWCGRDSLSGGEETLSLAEEIARCCHRFTWSLVVLLRVGRAYKHTTA